MLDDWRRRRRAKRITPGDGRPLKRFRWWQLLGRSLMYLDLVDSDGTPTAYAISVSRGGDAQTGEVKGQLYANGRLRSESKLPAEFPVEGGVIEVRTSEFGLRRCHYVTADGVAHQLTPDPQSAEGRRARLERHHPALSRAVGVASVLILGVGATLMGLFLVESLVNIPPVVERFGSFRSPVQLPWWLDATVAVVTILAATERALRLRYHWLLDGAAG